MKIYVPRMAWIPQNLIISSFELPATNSCDQRNLLQPPSSQIFSFLLVTSSSTIDHFQKRSQRIVQLIAFASTCFTPVNHPGSFSSNNNCWSSSSSSGGCVIFCNLRGAIFVRALPAARVDRSENYKQIPKRRPRDSRLRPDEISSVEYFPSDEFISLWTMPVFQ